MRACPLAATAIGTTRDSGASTARNASPFTLHLLHSIIRGFLDDLHVVHMRFAHAGRGDLDELGTLLHVRDIGAAHIAHRRAQTTHQLLDDCDDRPLVGHAAFHTFGHQLVGRFFVVLKIAIARTLLHGADRTHATIGLVGAPLIKLDLARRFFRAGEQATEHDRVRTGCNRLRDVPGITDPAAGDHRPPRLFDYARNILHGGDLRHTHARHDTCSAYRARANAHFDAVGAMIQQCLGGDSCCDIAAYHLELREITLYPFHPIEHALGMTMCRVDHQHAQTRLHEHGRSFLGALAHADCGTYAQPAEVVLACIGMLRGFEDVLYCNQAAQMKVAIDH